jgi:hypothetical protein
MVMFFFLCPVDAGIQKIDSFGEAKEILAKADKKTVVVFDVDETIVTKKCPLLQDRNCDRTIACDFWDLLDGAPINAYFKIRAAIFLAQEILIENEIPKIIKEIQNNGAYSLVITSRANGSVGFLKNLEDALYESLKGFGIDFSSSFPIKDPYFSDGNLLFYKGLGFVLRDKKSGKEAKNKGEVLIELVEQAKIMPEHVVFLTIPM